jgi:hypothetical protein
MVTQTVSHEVVLKRRENLASVLGTMAGEGEAPGPEAMSLFERYANGDLDLTQVRRELETLHSNVIRQVNGA